MILISLLIILFVALTGCKDKGELSKYIVDETEGITIEGEKTIYTHDIKSVVDGVNSIVIRGGNNIDIGKSSDNNISIEMKNIIWAEKNTKEELEKEISKYVVEFYKDQSKLVINVKPKKMKLYCYGATLDFMIYLPDDLEIKIDNEFGDININDIRGIFDIKKYSGIVNFRGEMLPSVQHFFSTEFGLINIMIKRDTNYELYMRTGRFGRVNSITTMPVFADRNQKIKSTIYGFGIKTVKVKVETQNGEIFFYKDLN